MTNIWDHREYTIIIKLLESPMPETFIIKYAGKMVKRVVRM